MSHSHKAYPKHHYQSGMTLIELMVGLVISLIIIGAATAVFLAANSIGRSHDVGARLLEDGAFAATKLTRGIQRTGYVDVFSGTGRFRQTFDDAVNTIIERADPTQRDAFGLRYGNVTGSNTAIFGCENSILGAGTNCIASGTNSALAIAYQTNTPASVSDLSPSVINNNNVSSGSGSADCNGARPPANVDYVLNKYYVNNQNQLMCLGNGSNTPGRIAANVQQFQVLYGIASGAVDRRVQLLTASQVQARNAWNLVVQVDLCLVMVGAPGTDNNPSITNNCDGSTTSTTDTRMRKTFRSVVSLRNSMG